MNFPRVFFNLATLYTYIFMLLNMLTPEFVLKLKYFNVSLCDTVSGKCLYYYV